MRAAALCTPTLTARNRAQYWFWIPILSYIYFRNITLTFRSYHSSLLNWIGKITLETYLLQFHVFMRAHQEGKPWKPEMLLALVPGYPMWCVVSGAHAPVPF